MTLPANVSTTYLYDHGLHAEAGIDAMQATEEATTSFDLRRACGVAGQLGSETANRGLEALLAERGQGTGQGSATGESQLVERLALEALALLYYGTGWAEEARSTANTLLSEFAATPHARRGWLTRFAIAYDAGDLPSAEAALAAVERAWPTYETEVLRTARAVARAQTPATGGETVAPTEAMRQAAPSASHGIPMTE